MEKYASLTRKDIKKTAARGLTFEEPTDKNNSERHAIDQGDFLKRVTKKALTQPLRRNRDY